MGREERSSITELTEGLGWNYSTVHSEGSYDDL